jgi:hypothetical protein
MQTESLIKIQDKNIVVLVMTDDKGEITYAQAFIPTLVEMMLTAKIPPPQSQIDKLNRIKALFTE